MVNRGIFILISIACSIAASAAQSPDQTRIVDLTNTTPNPAEWKIVASGTGGPIGTWPVPPSHVPVTVHLTNCAVRNAELFFSVEIENNRKLEVQVPVSMNPKLFDRRGTTAFRELSIQLGTATNTQDPSTFEHDPNLPSIVLFGDQSVPGTIAVLAPGERLVLRLKSEIQPRDQNVSSLRVRIGAFDQTLSPSGDGFRKIGTLIPALFAMSESTCSESKPEVK
jgi:hypothetical protein